MKRTISIKITRREIWRSGKPASCSGAKGAIDLAPVAISKVDPVSRPSIKRWVRGLLGILFLLGLSGPLAGQTSKLPDPLPATFMGWTDGQPYSYCGQDVEGQRAPVTQKPTPPITASQTFVTTAQCDGMTLVITQKVTVSPEAVVATATGNTPIIPSDEYSYIFSLTPNITVKTDVTVNYTATAGAGTVQVGLSILKEPEASYLSKVNCPGMSVPPATMTGVGNLNLSYTCTWPQDYGDIGGWVGGESRVQVMVTPSTAKFSTFGLYTQILPQFFLKPASSLIEVVQVAQSVSTDKPAYNLPLIAGKTGVVRLYPISTTSKDQVKAALHVMVGGKMVGDLPIIDDVAITPATTVDRANKAASFNFFMPALVTMQGPIQLVGEFKPVAPNGALPIAPLPLPLTFQKQANPLTVKFIGYCVPVPANLILNPVCPEDRIGSYGANLADVLPTADGGVNYQPLLIAPVLNWNKSLLTDAGQDAFINNLRRLYLLLNSNIPGVAGDQLVAWLPAGATTPLTGGAFTTGNADPAWGKGAGTPALTAAMGHVLFAVDNGQVMDGKDILPGDLVNPLKLSPFKYLAHELGHNLGLRHVNTKDWSPNADPSRLPRSCWPYGDATIQNAGFYPNGPSFIPKTSWDLMSYQLGDIWLSPYTYDVLVRGNLRPQNDSINSNVSAGTKTCPASATSNERGVRITEEPPARKQLSPNATAVDSIIISGTIASNGTAAFQPGYRITTTAQLDTSDPNGAYCLRFNGSAGTLTTFCFDVTTTNIETGNTVDPASFSFQVAFPAQTTSVALYSGGTQLTSVPVASKPPTVAITSPKPGDRWSGGMQTIAWTGSDPGGASLIYAVLYSTDGGSTFMPMDIDDTNTQFTFDSSRIAGGANVFFEVMASNGFTSATAMAGPINVTQIPALMADTAVDTGNAAIGQVATATLHLTNTGSGPLTITAASFDNPAFTMAGVMLPLTIQAGGNRSAQIQFSPTVAGSQSGTLTLTSNSAGGPVKVTVTGRGSSTSVPSVRLSATATDFGMVNVGSTADRTLTVFNTGNTGLVVSSVGVSGTGFQGVGIQTPFTVAAATSQDLTLRFAPTSAGSQTGALTLKSNDPANGSITVTLTGVGQAVAANAPQIASGGIVNAASFAPRLARGALSTIFGTNLATSTAPASSLPLPVSLGGASVTVGGVPAPLVYVSPTQINFQVPANVPAGSSSSLVVTVGGVASAAAPVTMADYGVGIFSCGSSPCAVHNATGQLVTTANPATPSEVLVLYATGIGKLSAAVPSGTASPSSPLAAAADNAAMTLGGSPVQVFFAGLTPGYVGLVQFNVQLPASLPTGNLPLVVTLPGDSSIPVNLPVQGNSTSSSPKMTLSASTLAFGPVPVGQTSTMSVTVSNNGTAALTISSFTTAAPFSVVSASAPVTVAVGASAAISVRFAPVASGAASGTLTIAGNDQVNPVVAVALTGSGTAPGISVSASSLSFGNVTVGQAPGTQSLNVTNSGGVAVTVTAKTAAPFSVSPASLPLAVGQSGSFTVTFTPAVAGAATGSLALSIGSPNDPPPVSLTGTGVVSTTTPSITQTFVYHEITSFTKQVRLGNGGSPVLSASGNRAVYFNAPGDETDARYNDIFVVNSDGTGQRLVDSYKQNCTCGGIVDISADGSTVVSTDSMELRIASATSGTGKRLITNRNIPYLRISPKGDKVFFIHQRGDASSTDATTERGLYVINADGTGIKQLAGPKAVGALFGYTLDQISSFATNGWSLDVSADGTKLVFGVPTPGGERILEVNADGTGLKQLMGPFSSVNHAALSGDGTKVAYDVVAPPCCSTPNEIGVINYDGTGRKALATNVNTLNGNLRMELSNDGSKLLYGTSALLYSTDGSGAVALSVAGGSFSSDPAILVNNGWSLATMNGAANRFLYASGDDAGNQQLATMDINPAALGEAPAISSPTLTQTSIALNGANQSTISAAVKTSNKVTRVSAAVINGAVSDSDVNAPVMLDDGTSGDVAARDGVYTSNQLRADCCAVLGPRTVRVRAEVRDSSNHRHASAIEFGGLTVVSKAP